MGIPVSAPLLDGNEKKYLNECIDSGWISSEGPFVGRLEQAFASFLGLHVNGCAVSNGTAALEAALYGLGIRAGDEVIVPSFTIVSCALACFRLGAIPVLVDCESRFWGIDVTQIEKKITAKTRCIMAVHIYGCPVDMDPLLSIAEKYNLFVLEDIAEAIGCKYKGRLCGTMGDAAAVSFYANKLVSCGEGGMVISSSPEVINRARSYRNLCFGKTERFRHEDIGYNFRMTNLQAAVGCAQLEQFECFSQIKARNGAQYRQALADIPGIRFMEFPDYAEGVYWMYAVKLTKKEKRAADAMQFLKNKGIGTRPFFLGLHDQPAFVNEVIAKGTFPCSDDAYQYGFYLPSGLTLTRQDIGAVVAGIREFLS